MDFKKTDYNDIHLETYKFHEGQHSYTLLIDEKPIICSGIVVIAKGIGEVWTVSDKTVDKYPIAVHKSILKLLNKFDQLKFHRLQAICAMIGNSGKWLEKLGFEKEGIMRQFGENKEDYLLYGRIR